LLSLIPDDRPRLQRIRTDDLPTTPEHVRLDDARTPSLTSSISEAETVIRWKTPPSRLRTPQQSSETLTPRASAENTLPVGINEDAEVSNIPFVVRFDEEQIRSDEAQAASKRRRRMDTGSFDSSEPPTPGIDDTPYIRFAIDQLTRDEEIRPNSGRSSDSYPVERIVENHYRDSYTESGTLHTREDLALVRKHRSSPSSERLFTFNPTRPLSYNSVVEPSVPINQDIFVPVNSPMPASRYPELTFVPTILRPLSMITIALLCLLMIASLMFCAIYSTDHNGLVDFAGIYGGRYFVFSFLPQILAAVLFMIIHEVMSATKRMLPFTLMALDDAERRSNALFLGLYQKSFLLPKWDGVLSLDIASLFFWLSMFTIPLQSCLFSAILVGGVWRWAAVQAIAWTLAAIYVLVLVGVVITALFFYRRTTGLMWDPRSLADIIVLLPRSNSLKDYPGTDVMASKEEIQHRLRLRSDRLGYWRTPNRTKGVFYCLGEEGASTRRYTLEAGILQEKSSGSDLYRSSDVEKATIFEETIRHRSISWYLRDTFVILWAVTAFVLILAIFIVSFLPTTAIQNGFAPYVPSAPNAQGFSAANFLYSFIPSILGLLLYLMFQPLDMSLRQLQPWGELSRHGGGTADQSLLSDYAASSPLGCAWSALDAGHYRVSIISLLSFIFILLPILGGGLFFPLTTHNEVLMVPNLPAFYILLTTLILYLIGLLLLVPKRRLLHLPHAVDCLAEIFSFVHNSQMLDDAAFRAPRSKADLVTRLMSVRAGGREARYEFGVHQGRDGSEWMGIERVGRDGHRNQHFKTRHLIKTSNDLDEMRTRRFDAFQRG
jgi:hypothetical protein